MPLLSKASNVVQNVFFLYDVTGFTQIGHSIPVATNCTSAFELSGALGWTEPHNRNSSAMVFQIARSVSSGSNLHAAAQQQLNAGVHGP